MQLTASQIADLVGGTLEGDPHQVVHDVAGLREAQPGDVTFLSDPKYLPAVKRTRAGVLIATSDAVLEGFSGTVIRCQQPIEAFAKLVQHVSPPPVTYQPGISKQAAVHPTAQLGVDVSVQPFAVIEEGAVIGDRTVVGSSCYIGAGCHVGSDSILYPSVILRERTTIGNRGILHGGVVIGADGFGFEFRNGKHEKIPQLGSVEIGDDVEIGANSAIDRGRFGKTRIGSGTKIDNLVQIGHNCVIGQHCVVCGLVGIAGSTLIGDRVTIAGQVGIAGHLTIGDQVIVMGQSGVTKDIPSGSIVWGLPAMPQKKYKQINAALRRLPQTTARFREVEKLLAEIQVHLGKSV